MKLSSFIAFSLISTAAFAQQALAPDHLLTTDQDVRIAARDAADLVASSCVAFSQASVIRTTSYLIANSANGTTPQVRSAMEDQKNQLRFLRESIIVTSILVERANIDGFDPLKQETFEKDVSELLSMLEKADAVGREESDRLFNAQKAWCKGAMAGAKKVLMMGVIRK